VKQVESRVLIDLFFDPEDGGKMFLRNVFDFNGLHDIISQYIELFITTALRTSNPTCGLTYS
jgi:hypothetical protein